MLWNIAATIFIQLISPITSIILNQETVIAERYPLRLSTSPSNPFKRVIILWGHNKGFKDGSFGLSTSHGFPSIQCCYYYYPTDWFVRSLGLKNCEDTFNGFLNHNIPYSNWIQDDSCDHMEPPEDEQSANDGESHEHKAPPLVYVQYPEDDAKAPQGATSLENPGQPLQDGQSPQTNKQRAIHVTPSSDEQNRQGATSSLEGQQSEVRAPQEATPASPIELLPIFEPSPRDGPVAQNVTLPSKVPAPQSASTTSDGQSSQAHLDHANEEQPSHSVVGGGSQSSAPLANGHRDAVSLSGKKLPPGSTLISNWQYPTNQGYSETSEQQASEDVSLSGNGKPNQDVGTSIDPIPSTNVGHPRQDGIVSVEGQSPQGDTLPIVGQPPHGSIPLSNGQRPQKGKISAGGEPSLYDNPSKEKAVNRNNARSSENEQFSQESHAESENRDDSLYNNNNPYESGRTPSRDQLLSYLLHNGGSLNHQWGRGNNYDNVRKTPNNIFNDNFARGQSAFNNKHFQA